MKLLRVRLQRGSLSESLETMAMIAPTREALLDYLEPHYGDLSHRRLEVKPYTSDDRIGWDTHLVVVDNHALAYTDGPVMEEEQCQ